MQIALFTPFSPEIGGGSAQLRSHLRFLPGLNVTWYYLAARPAASAEPNWKWLGPGFSAPQLLLDLSARTKSLPGSKSHAAAIVERLEGDFHWVVSHNEGISIAAELSRRGKPFHLTVHDDPIGTWTRSRRYAMFRALLPGIFSRVLRNATSIDVTSWGTRGLYRSEYRVQCFSLYLHVPRLAQLAAARDPDKLTVGHIGTLYDPRPFSRFVKACRRVAGRKNRTLRILRIGGSAQMDAVAEKGGGVFESLGELCEDAAIPILAGCDLLYAMYPPGWRYQIFRRTSLPIKLSTYVQAQRPIFAHTPADSTLARIVGPYVVGEVCEGEDEEEISKQIENCLERQVPSENFERLRRELMGFEQVQQLEAALCRQDWRAFREFDFKT